MGSDSDASEGVAQLIGSRWLEYTAKGMCWHPLMDWQDSAQVGAVAAWKAFKTFNPDATMHDGGAPVLMAWVKFKARTAMLTYVQRFRVDTVLTVVADTDTGRSGSTIDVAFWGVHEDNVESAECPREAVNAAVAKLTPAQQKYVKARFWDGKTHTEVSNEAGYNIAGLWYGKGGAAERLRRSLREAVSV